MPEIPAPNYDYNVAEIVKAFKSAVEAIQRELDSFDATDTSRANTQAALAEIAKILASLNAESAKWVEENIPKAARDGVVRAIVSLGVVDTVAEAEKIAKFSRVNANMVKAVIADTQADLLAVTQNIDRRTKQAVRKAVADAQRANMAAGINGRRTINRDTLAGIRRALGSAADTGIIDAAGRRWKPEVYVDMVTRTKLLAAHKEASINEALARDVMYARISRHGAADGCGKWEGKIVKLAPDAPGDYPYVGDLPRNEIFHPNCKHVLSPVRNPDK
jgi:hypothetical protein